MNLGVRRVVLCGVPLTPCIPMIGQSIDAVPMFHDPLMGALKALFRGCNSVLLLAMERALRDAQVGEEHRSLEFSTCLDESNAIEAACAAAMPNGPCLWFDESHPSQALHSTLANDLGKQLELQLLWNARGSDTLVHRHEDERKHLLPRTPMRTPRQSDAVNYYVE